MPDQSQTGLRTLGVFLHQPFDFLSEISNDDILLYNFMNTNPNCIEMS